MVARCVEGAAEGRVSLEDDAVFSAVLEKCLVVQARMPLDLVESGDHLRVKLEILQVFDEKIRNADGSNKSLLLKLR